MPRLSAQISALTIKRTLTIIGGDAAIFGWIGRLLSINHGSPPFQVMSFTFARREVVSAFRTHLKNMRVGQGCAPLILTIIPVSFVLSASCRILEQLSLIMETCVCEAYEVHFAAFCEFNEMKCYFCLDFHLNPFLKLFAMRAAVCLFTSGVCVYTYLMRHWSDCTLRLHGVKKLQLHALNYGRAKEDDDYTLYDEGKKYLLWAA